MKRLLIIPFLFIVFALSAAPIGERKAREIAMSFFAATATRSTSPEVALEWAGDKIVAGHIALLSTSNTDESLLYIYNRTDSAGFVVVAGDDGVEKQIVAFSYENNLQIENMSGGARYLLDGWCKQIAATRSGAEVATRAANGSDVGNVEKLYETALWSQGKPFNNEAPVIDGYRAITGCVATAMSIICYHNRWPEKGVGTTPSYKYRDYYNKEQQVPANTLGRTYDYANMRSDNYENGYTSAEAAAVAALMKDIGTSVRMNYHYEASGAYSEDVAMAMATYFGYTKASVNAYGDGYTTKEWAKVLKNNIANFGPSYFCGSGEEGGHAFVLDGYTSANYFHINFGWGGVDNGYYLIPKIEFAEGQMIILNLEPDRDGTSTYKDNLLLYRYPGRTDFLGLTTNVTKYNTGFYFDFDCGYILNDGMQDFNGAVRVALCDKDGALKEILVDDMSINDLPSGYLTAFSVRVCIDSAIAPGDRIRVEYKGSYSDDWQWLRAASLDIAEEIIVALQTDDIAKSLGMKFDKTSRKFTFASTYDLTYEVIDSSNNSKTSGAMEPKKVVTIDASTWSKGAYDFCFRRDGSEYKLTIVL